MAEKNKPKKKHLHKIITTRAHDGSFGHDHVYKDHPDDAEGGAPVFAGTSRNLEDVHAHMDDHLGGDNEQAEEAAEGEGAPAAGGEEPPQQA